MLRDFEVEVLSPAGSFESLMAAFQGGANAVYFGIGDLNMRAKSTLNFTVADLPQVVQMCHKRGVKAYLTVNTVLYDQDMEPMHEIMQTAANEGVDAVIVSDQAAMTYARMVGLEVHLSTQLNISNLESLQFYSQWADVVVLARELNLQQVSAINEGIRQRNIVGPSGKPIKIEMFVHGALCMAISGKCYLSLHEANLSANRGSCIQICRHSYTVTDNETGAQLAIDNEYVMSPKDLCTIGFLDRILEAGASVLKIEGRARAPEYVKTVTECYREAVQAVTLNTYTEEKIADWTQRLSAVFNRGFWDGYYLGRRLGEWSHRYGSAATERKQYVGKVVNYFSKLGVAEIAVEATQLHVGQHIMIIGPTTGVLDSQVTQLEVDEKPAEFSPQGVHCSIKVPQKVRRADKLFIVSKVEQ